MGDRLIQPKSSAMVLIMKGTFREEFEKLMSPCAIFTLLDLEKMQYAGFFLQFSKKHHY